MRRFMGGLLAAFISVAVVVGDISPVAADPVALETQFVTRLNAFRKSKGLAPVSVDPRLTALGRAWAQKMADRNDIFHNMNLPNEAPREWLRLGENVGVGLVKEDEDVVEAIHHAFVRSRTHYANLVGRFTKVGIGVVEANGQVFVAQQFMTPQVVKRTAAKRSARRSRGWATARRR